MTNTAFSRRRALALTAFALAGTGCATRPPRFGADPFVLGVAAGDPSPDGFVIWTRLSDAGGAVLDLPEIPLIWEVSDQRAFGNIIRNGVVWCAPVLAHSAHVEVRGLQPDHEYFYRFRAGDAVSRTGRARTAPRNSDLLPSARIAFASCQHWEHAWFHAYRAMIAQDPRFILFLGDYIYERRSGAPPFVRDFAAPEPTDLAGYRARHALYKTDRDLQAAHAACAWILAWDDHEVANDYTGTTPPDPELDAAFKARRAAAYQAYFEHMPVRPSALLADGAFQMYRSLGLGRLARLHVLDSRQYRDPHPCPGSPRRGGRPLSDCATLNAPRTYLGQAQEAWFGRAFGASNASWDIIANPALLSPLDLATSDVATHWSDFWDGYPQARAQLLSAIEAKPDARALVLTGDLHSWWALEGPATDYGRPAYAEFIVGSLGSRPPRASLFGAGLEARNPLLRYVHLQDAGFGMAEITPDRACITFLRVDGVVRGATAEQLKAFELDRATMRMMARDR